MTLPKILWCKTHNFIAAEGNEHCGCEYSEGCSFDIHDAGPGFVPFINEKGEWTCVIVEATVTPV